MKIQTKIPLKGMFRMTKVWPDGHKEIHFEDDNLIVLTGRSAVLVPLYTAAVVSDPISHISLGTGGCTDINGLFPKIELLSQTALHTPVLSISTTPVPDLAHYKVTFIADLGQSVGNGSSFSEAGLTSVANSLFSVKNHPALAKTADFSVHYEWTIQCA